ncbi:MAG: hypothetical protein IIY21_19015 [Clostridiales bacterium]|nr:hypothetical protein [Clostridiales bacterium]MBQ1573773.1 hypothetical protein [Clostridiales bacterium]
MWSLYEFYHTKEWEKFREIVIAERMTDEGLILDEVTGKPITKRYDIILHHKIHLTEENVNDRNISLNPENIQIVSHRTHNLIHEKFGYKRKEIYLIYGSPCSGKSTYLDSVKQRGDLIVDVDRIRQCVSGMNTHEIVPALNSVVFGIRDYLMDAVRTRQGKWNRAYIIGGFPLISERERICKQTGAQEIYIESTKEECLRRFDAKPDGRDKEWKRYIEEWWERYGKG